MASLKTLTLSALSGIAFSFGTAVAADDDIVITLADTPLTATELREFRGGMVIPGADLGIVADPVFIGAFEGSVEILDVFDEALSITNDTLELANTTDVFELLASGAFDDVIGAPTISNSNDMDNFVFAEGVRTDIFLPEFDQFLALRATSEATRDIVIDAGIFDNVGF